MSNLNIKILHINGVYASGSTGAIVNALCNYLSTDACQHFIAFGIGQKVGKDNVFKFAYRYETAIYKRISRLIGWRYGFAPLSTQRLINYIKRIKPSIVHIHSINGNIVDIYKLIKFLNKESYPLVITQHAEFFFTGNCTSSYDCQGYKSGCNKCPYRKWALDTSIPFNTHKRWEKMKDAFTNYTNLNIVSVSPFVNKKSLQSPILINHPHRVILNGIDTDIFCYKRTEVARFDKTRKSVLFVTSEFSSKKSHLKGGWYLLQIAKLSSPYIHFYVVGSCNEIITWPNNISYLGNISNKSDLSALYSEADLTISLSRSETFGLICAESLCCGTPCVGFKSGGIESIAIDDWTEFVDYGMIDQLIDVIEIWLSKSDISKIEISNSAGQVYNQNNMTRQYNLLYEEILNG